METNELEFCDHTNITYYFVSVLSSSNSLERKDICDSAALAHNVSQKRVRLQCTGHERRRESATRRREEGASKQKQARDHFHSEKSSALYFSPSIVFFACISILSDIKNHVHAGVSSARVHHVLLRSPHKFFPTRVRRVSPTGSRQTHGGSSRHRPSSHPCAPPTHAAHPTSPCLYNHV